MVTIRLTFLWIFLLQSGERLSILAFIHLPSEDQLFRHHHILSSHQAVLDHDNIDVPIIFENDRLLAIVKPPNIPHHDDPATGQLGIMSLIRHQQQQQPNPSFSYPHRLYGVHRLDRVTSGILLLAKDTATASMLMTKFSEKEIKKYYMAVSGKKPKKKKQGWVKGVMKKGRRGSYKLVNSNSNQSKTKAKEDEINNDESSTREKKNIGYATTRFFTAGLGNLSMAPSLHENTNNNGESSQLIPKTAVLFQPYTGKTHQLRVAAKSLALPILGDVRYGGGCLEISTGDDDLDEDATAAIHFQIGENENITIWSPPPFDHLFSKTELNGVFVGLMEKYCDCPPIVDHIHRAAINQKQDI
ncbi:hypothetical protein ACHAXR_013175 [Thalassiosira sp. AJA248-18]